MTSRWILVLVLAAGCADGAGAGGGGDGGTGDGGAPDGGAVGVRHGHLV